MIYIYIVYKCIVLPFVFLNRLVLLIVLKEIIMTDLLLTGNHKNIL